MLDYQTKMVGYYRTYRSTKRASAPCTLLPAAHAHKNCTDYGLCRTTGSGTKDVKPKLDASTHTLVTFIRLSHDIPQFVLYITSISHHLLIRYKKDVQPKLDAASQLLELCRQKVPHTATAAATTASTTSPAAKSAGTLHVGAGRSAGVGRGSAMAAAPPPPLGGNRRLADNNCDTVPVELLDKGVSPNVAYKVRWCLSSCLSSCPCTLFAAGTHAPGPYPTLRSHLA